MLAYRHKSQQVNNCCQNTKTGWVFGLVGSNAKMIEAEHASCMSMPRRVKTRSIKNYDLRHC